MTTTDTGRGLEVRPSGPARWHNTRFAAVFCAFYLAVGLVLVPLGGLVYFAIYGGTGLLVLLALYLYEATLRIVVTADDVEMVNAFRRLRRPRGDVGAVLVQWVKPPRGEPLLFTCVLDHRGRRMLRMVGAVWGEEAMQQVVEGLGVQPSIGPYLLSTKQLRRVHPGAVSFIEAHPFASIGALTLLLLAIGIAALVAVFSI